MSEPSLIRLCMFVYMGSWVLYLLHVAFRKKAVGIAGDVAALAGLVLQTLAIGVRWMESYRIPWLQASIPALEKWDKACASRLSPAKPADGNKPRPQPNAGCTSRCSEHDQLS